MTRLQSIRTSAAAFWQGVRPRTRHGALRATGLIAGGALAVALVLFGTLWGGLALAAPYLEVTLHPERNAQALAGLDESYAGAALCATCHQPEVTKLTASKHAGIGCESCHGALLDHATSSPGPEADLLIGTPTADLCVKCHEQRDGRPADFPQVVLGVHYTDTCLACHNPHSGVSQKPPAVVHPITDLPPCITCHGEDAFKAREIRHPQVSQDDAACLACHELRPTNTSSVKQ